MPQAPSPSRGSAASPGCDCAPKETLPRARYVQENWSLLPGWPSEQLDASWAAWLLSCHAIGKKSGWDQLCQNAVQLPPAPGTQQIRAFFETHFTPWRIESVQPGQSKPQVQKTGRITGYYEPLLHGSLSPKPGYTPLYASPDDLLTIDLGAVYPSLKGLRLRGRLEGKRVVPYWTRAEINAQKRPLSAQVLVWVNDPVEAFFLEIQGSGRVQLENNQLLRLGFSDQNGFTYQSVGRWLVERGHMKLADASMQGIRAWGQAHPRQLREALEVNPSYVFFRILERAEGGPTGSLGVPLTDGASVAVDPQSIPLGTPLYLATTWPNNPKPLNRLVHAQDTGGVIKGPIRADFFWGFGDAAGNQAGRMNQQGTIWLLWPRNMPLPALP